jgi:hypothetical protein
VLAGLADKKSGAGIAPAPVSERFKTPL